MWCKICPVILRWEQNRASYFHCAVVFLHISKGYNVPMNQNVGSNIQKMEIKMKKTITILSLVLLLALCISITLVACNPETPDPIPESTDMPINIYVNGMRFQINANHTGYILVDIDAGIEDLVIPSMVEGFPVTGIGNFSFCDQIKSLVIPETVTELNYDIFYACDSLTKVTLPASLKSLSAETFRYCDNLAEIHFNGTMKQWCEMEVLDYGGGWSPFENVSKLYIDGKLVEGDLIIPEGVTHIRGLAFHANLNLTSITLPQSLTSIANGAFEINESLSTVNYLGTLEGWCKIDFNGGGSIVRYDAELRINGEVLEGDVVLPDTLTEIKEGTFDGFNISSLTIPASIKDFGFAAFQSVSSLDTVYYLGTLEQWCNITFENYSSNPMSRANNLYINGAQLSGEVIIPNAVTKIKDFAFLNVRSMTNVTLHNGITSIGNEAFAECSNLASVAIGENVTKIGKKAFLTCNRLTAINVDPENANYKSIDGNLYSKDGKTLIQYAIGKTDTNFEIPEGVTTIANYAFYNCSRLINIEIPDGVTEIGAQAFNACDKLTSMIIPDSVTVIGAGATIYCVCLTDVYFTGTEEQWNAISIGSANDYLKNATIHFNYVPEEN